MATAPQPPEHTAYNAANPDYDDKAVRAGLRREFLAARAALTPLEHGRLSARLEAHLEGALTLRRPGVLAFCWPVRNEFDARGLVRRLLAQGWRACMPVVVAADAPMRFRSWTPEAAMGTDRYGIPIPADTAESSPPDIVLLPLVAFDRAGHRLGYGGGYFDRTLAALMPRPAAWGVGFELSRTTELRPLAHDIALDAIVTEAGFASTGVAPEGAAALPR